MRQQTHTHTLTLSLTANNGTLTVTSTQIEALVGRRLNFLCHIQTSGNPIQIRACNARQLAISFKYKCRNDSRLPAALKKKKGGGGGSS